jgi:hypothetical protein
MGQGMRMRMEVAVVECSGSHEKTTEAKPEEEMKGANTASVALLEIDRVKSRVKHSQRRATGAPRSTPHVRA